MRNYEQLKAIAEIYTKSTSTIPNNPMLLSNQLQIPYKLKFQYKGEYGERNPVENTPAMLIRYKNENVIYIDENAKYWKFYFFHELAHYILEHDSDQLEQEREANILACLLMAPPNLLPTYLKSSNDLCCFAKIPIGHAEEYWENLKFHKKPHFKMWSIALCLCVFCSFLIFFTNINKANVSYDIENTPVPTIVATSETDFYVTKTGKKYHVYNCPYIKNKTDIRKITVSEVSDYSPCKYCITKESSQQ